MCRCAPEATTTQPDDESRADVSSRSDQSPHVEYTQRPRRETSATCYVLRAAVLRAENVLCAACPCHVPRALGNRHSSDANQPAASLVDPIRFQRERLLPSPLLPSALPDPVARTRAAARGAVAGIREAAPIERQAATANALAQASLHALELGDALVDACPPPARQLCPVGAIGRRGCAAAWRARRRSPPATSPPSAQRR